MWIRLYWGSSQVWFKWVYSIFAVLSVISVPVGAFIYSEYPEWAGTMNYLLLIVPFTLIMTAIMVGIFMVPPTMQSDKSRKIVPLIILILMLVTAGVISTLLIAKINSLTGELAKKPESATSITTINNYGAVPSNNSPSAPLLTVWINWARAIKKVPNPNGPNYPFIFVPYAPNDWNAEDSIIAANYRYFVPFRPMKLDSNFAQLSVDNKTIQSAPLFFTYISQEMFYPISGELNGGGTLQYYMLFKYKGIIEPGNYNDATISVVAENTTYTSPAFTLFIPPNNGWDK